ncbi:hypothetical protein [Cellulophaga sp. Z1A5H]|uniref:hypothetical protein n=1 Tax=Cellulophaga sp. Z1A5H TaxID=2687291 RepID=UPI0013FE28FB|nr:hypothetical protein [Cellulophaga sp. Z1A5H]
MEKQKKDYYFDKFTDIFKNIGINNSLNHIHNNVYEFYNDFNENRYSIFIENGWGEKGFLIGNVRSRIAFNQVNKILKKYIPKSYFEISEATLNNGYINNKWSDLMQTDFNNYLKSDEDIQNFEKKITQHTQEYILPFFNKFTKLESIQFEIYDKLEYDEYPEFFPGNCTFKNLIIMQELNYYKLKDYIIYKDNDYKKYVLQNADMWQSSYEDFKVLVKDIGHKL